MSLRARRKLLIMAIITVIVATGASVLALASLSILDPPEPKPLNAAARGLVTALFICFPALTIEFFYFQGQGGAWLRRRRFIEFMIIRTLTYLAVFVAGIWLGALAVSNSGLPEPGWNAQTLRQLGFATTITLLANFLIGIDRLLGQAVFQNFLTGRYHQPVTEQRILLFADLVGSTTMAEQIGNLPFHRLLNNIYHDLTGPVLEARGVIHKYVGDEMIVSWADSSENRDRALICARDLQDRLRGQAETYNQTFGVSPAIRIGLHAGEVIVGEMGDVRQEIVYLGDAMNIAARLVDECRTSQRTLMVSADLIADSAREGLEPIGTINIRGRAGQLPVWGLEGEGAQP